jgi:hypothetical protein
MFSNPDIYFMMDSDMFFVADFNIDDFKKYYFCYVDQNRIINNKIINYPWPNLFYMDINQIPNKELINWYPDYGLDSGGKCAEWLSKLEKEKTYQIKSLCSGRWDSKDLPKKIDNSILLFLENDRRNKDNKYFAELYDDKILHYRAGSNWMNDSYELQQSMTNLLLSTLSKLYE